jgi:hypothetical protein
MKIKIKNPVTTISPIFFYIFFLFHSWIFAISWFMIFYTGQMPLFGFLHWWIAIFVYLSLYSAVFWKEEIRNMLIGALIWALQIYSWLELIWSSLINETWYYKTFASMPLYYHIVPGLYFIMYTFLLKNAMIDLIWARNNPERSNIANWTFYIISLLFFLLPKFAL